MTQQIHYKVLLLGDCEVGKTCLLHYEDPPLRYAPTHGVEFSIKALEMGNGQKIKLQCWDIAGSETFRAIQYTYFRKCKACLVMFDVTKTQSFNSVTRWITKISDYGENSDPLLYLVGSKIDLVNERAISQERAQILANKMGLRYIEVSSFLKYNVELAYQLVANELCDSEH